MPPHTAEPGTWPGLRQIAGTLLELFRIGHRSHASENPAGYRPRAFQKRRLVFGPTDKAQILLSSEQRPARKAPALRLRRFALSPENRIPELMLPSLWK